VDAVELPREDGTGWSIMSPAWPKRIVFGQAGVLLEDGRQTGLRKH
jgi:hypothetical protein